MPGEITRNFMGATMSSPTTGYFSRTELSLPPRVKFQELDKAQYKKIITEFIDANPKTLATAVECFAPFYGQAVARWLCQDLLISKIQGPVCVVEIGGGTGRAAADILGLIRTHFPGIYSEMSYVIIESSPIFARKQAELLRSEGHENVKIINQDILSWESEEFVAKHCVILGLELLSNLPHDKVLRNGDRLEQVHVMERPEIGVMEEEADLEILPNKTPFHLSYCEIPQPLTDPLIRECLELFDSLNTEEFSFSRMGRYGSMGPGKGWMNKIYDFFRAADERLETIYLPTGAYRLMRILHRYFPKHSFLFADLQLLVEQPVGHFAPAVAYNRSALRDVETDFPSYLGAMGSAEIFHPSSFPLLQWMYEKVALAHNSASPKARLMDQDEFLVLWSKPGDACLKDGENPMLMDFGKRLLLKTRAADLSFTPSPAFSASSASSALPPNTNTRTSKTSKPKPLLPKKERRQ